MAAQRHSAVAMGTSRSQSVLLLGLLNSAPAAMASIFSDAAMGTTEMLASPSSPPAHPAERAWGWVVTQWGAGLLEHEVTQFQQLLRSSTFKFKAVN